MYYGEIAAYGDQVNIIKEPTITVGAYYRGSTVNIQDLADDQDTLTVDQSNYFAFKVDDIEEKQSHVNWKALSESSGAYALKDAYDTNVLAYMDDQALAANIYGANTNAGSIDVGYAAGEVSPLNFMSRLARLLDDQNVPEDNRWFVAHPIFWEAMSDENSKLMGVDFTGDSASRLRNNRVTEGKIRGFDCYKSNNLNTTTDTNVIYTAMAGHMSSTSTASQITESEMIRSQDSFADIYRGLHVFGRKTLRTEALCVGYYKVD